MQFREQLISAISGHGERNSFCIQNEYYTYADLGRRVCAIQSTINNDHSELQRIGIVLSDTIDTYAAIVAVLLLGKTYIPIHPGHPADRVARIVEQAQLKLLLSGIPGKNYAGVANIHMGTLEERNGQIICRSGDVSKEEAYILFTSGSTGVPKGTPISYRNLQSFLEAFGKLGYTITSEDRFLQMFDLTFDLSVMSYLVPLCAGACVYTIPDKGMKYTNVYGILETYYITFALMVPSILTFLRQYFSEISLPDMRYSLFCGEALHKDLAMEWQSCVPNAIIDNVYGPTEATIFCMSYRVTGQEITENNGIVSIGKPMWGMEVMVTGDNNEPLGDEEKGELCLSGGQLTAGYLDKEKNKTAFFEHAGKRYYRTGDIVYRNADGDYIYCGRADHQVKIQGFRVELSEIEHHVRTAYTCNAVAVVISNSQGLSQINVVLERDAVDKDMVMTELKRKLPAYMMPSALHFVAPFPLNVNGKTDRRELEKKITAGEI